MKRQNLLSSLILFLQLNSLNVLAQNKNYSVTGSVTDMTHLPVEFATITLLNNTDSSYVKGEISDLNGKFKISDIPSGNYILYISHLLYERKYMDVPIVEDLGMEPILLESSTNELRTVVVTANMIQNKSDRYIVSLKNNPITKGNNTTELLELMPGVTNEKGSLKINGQDVYEIYLDGRKLRDRKELESIPAEYLDKVEVLYMAGSEHDAAAMGGVIHIKLKKLASGGFYGAVSGDYSVRTESGPYSDNIRSSFSYQYKKLNIYNSVSYSDSKQVSDYSIFTEYRSIDRLLDMKTKERGWNHIFSDRLSLLYEIDKKHTIGGNFRISVLNGSPVQSSYSIGRNHSDKIVSRTGSDIDREIRNNQYQIAFNYNWLLDKKGSNFKIIVDYLKYDNQTKRNNLYYYDLATSDEHTNQSYHKINNKTDMLETDAKVELKLKPTSQLDFGFNYSFTHTSQYLDYKDLLEEQWIQNTELSDKYKLDGRNYAGYISYSSSMGARIMYKAGVRLQDNQIEYNSLKMEERNSKSYWGVYPSLNIMYNINPKERTVLTLGYQRAMNPIPYSAINPVVVYNNENSYTKGNLTIKPVNVHVIMAGGVLKNTWNLNYIFVKGKDYLYYKTFVDEKNPLQTYTMPVNNGSMSGHILSLDRTFKVFKWWNMKATIRSEWINHQADEKHICTWKPYFALVNTFRWEHGWGGNVSANFEPSYKTEERVYKKVHGLQGRVYKNLLKNKLQINLNFIVYAHNRVLITDTPDVWNRREFTTNQTGFTIGMTYNFQKGKKVNVKQSRSIQSYNELKDN